MVFGIFVQLFQEINHILMYGYLKDAVNFLIKQQKGGRKTSLYFIMQEKHFSKQTIHHQICCG